MRSEYVRSGSRYVLVKGHALVIVPGYSFSEHIIPLLLCVPSCPPSALLLRGHLSCWRALLRMAQLRDEQSSRIGPIRVLWI